MAHCGHKGTGGSSSGKHSLAWALLEVTIFSPRPSPTQQPTGMPQANQPTGEEHSPTHQQTGCLKSSWAHRCPLNIPLETALPTWETRPSSTHQWAGTSPSHQKACTSLLDQPYPPGGRQQKQELQPCRLWNRNLNHRKLDKMRWQRNMSHVKEKDKTPEEQLQSTQKRIQSNDSKDDPRSWKKNRGTDQQDTRNV